MCIVVFVRKVFLVPDVKNIVHWIVKMEGFAIECHRRQSAVIPTATTGTMPETLCILHNLGMWTPKIPPSIANAWDTSLVIYALLRTKIVGMERNALMEAHVRGW